MYFQLPYRDYILEHRLRECTRLLFVLYFLRPRPQATRIVMATPPHLNHRTE